MGEKEALDLKERSACGENFCDDGWMERWNEVGEIRKVREEERARRRQIMW